MNKHIFIFIISLIMIQTVFAQDLPNQRILSNQNIYGLKKAYEYVEGITYRIRNKEYEHSFIQAERRLAELEQLTDSDIDTYADYLITEYENKLNETEIQSEVIKYIEDEEIFQSMLAERLELHADIIEGLQSRVNTETRTRLQSMKQNAQTYQLRSEMRHDDISNLLRKMGR